MDEFTEADVREYLEACGIKAEAWQIRTLTSVLNTKGPIYIG